MPQQYRTQSPIRDAAAETFLSQVVANPFSGLFPDTPGATARRSRGAGCSFSTRSSTRRLCTGGGTFCTETYDGSNTYHGLIFRADKRFTRGFMLMTSYTWSHMREKRDAAQSVGSARRSPRAVDRPHRVTLATRRRTAVRPRPPLGQRLERRRRRRARRLAVQRELRDAVGSAARVQQQPLLRSGVRRSEGL